MADWVTISALATAGGTPVLAGTTYAPMLSAKRAARVAELSLLAGLRPVLVPSSTEDADVRVGLSGRRLRDRPRRRRRHRGDRRTVESGRFSIEVLYG